MPAAQRPALCSASLASTLLSVSVPVVSVSCSWNIPISPIAFCSWPGRRSVQPTLLLCEHQVGRLPCRCWSLPRRIGIVGCIFKGLQCSSPGEGQQKRVAWELLSGSENGMLDWLLSSKMHFVSMRSSPHSLQMCLYPEQCLYRITE